jgi:SHS2 domain-containing protein
MPFELTDKNSCADIGLIATADTLVDLFSDSAVGLTYIMAELDRVSDKRVIPIEVDGDNLENLYYRWLSEIIYLKDAENFLLKRCDIKIDEQGRKVTGKIAGDTIDPARHILKIDVKAVTYYKFKIEKIGQTWRGEAVFDL